MGTRETVTGHLGWISCQHSHQNQSRERSRKQEIKALDKSLNRGGLDAHICDFY